VQIMLQLPLDASLSSHRWNDACLKILFFTFTKCMLNPSCFDFVLRNIFKDYFIYLELKDKIMELIYPFVALRGFVAI